MKKLSSILFLAITCLLWAGCSDNKDELATEPPVEPGTDPEVTVTDLSADATANSYIINKEGDYSFKANIMGNGVPTVGTTGINMTPASAELLWQDAAGLVSNVKYEDSKITFTAGDGKGNAVIAAKDASGNILWSWHLWFTAYNPTYEAIQMNGVAWMDRNLGAGTHEYDENGTVKGLIYQWGRKDPFPALENWTDFDGERPLYDAEGKQVHPFKLAVVDTDNNMENSILNPTVYYSGVRSDDKGPYDWYTSTEYTKMNDKLWETEGKAEKTMYDPCPPGWRVPKSSAFTGLNNNTFIYDELSGGRLNDQLGYFPAAGLRGFEGGIWTGVSTMGDYWSSTSDTEGRVRTLHFLESMVNPRGRNYRAAGMPVRCVSEKQLGNIPEPGTDYDIIIEADRSVEANYIPDQGTDGSANYYIILSNVTTAANDKGQFEPSQPGSIVCFDLYGAASKDAQNAELPVGTYTFGSNKETGIANSDNTWMKYCEADMEIKYRDYTGGSVTVTREGENYNIDATFTTTDNQLLHIVYTGTLDFINRGETSIKTVIENPVNTEFKMADIIFQYSSATNDRYSINLYDGTFNGGYLTDGYAMHIDLATECISTKEDIKVKPGIYTVSQNMDVPGTYMKGSVLSLIGSPVYIGTYCQEVRPSNTAVLYGFAVEGTIEVKNEGENYEFIVDIITPEGVTIKGKYPMGKVTLIDKSPNKPGGDWESILKEDKTILFNEGDQSNSIVNMYGEAYYPNTSDFDIAVHNYNTNESFYLRVLAPKGAKSPVGTYTTPTDSKNPVAGNFVPGYRNSNEAVLRGTWSYVAWTEGYEDGGAPGIDGTITISDAGDGKYKIEYELKDDAKPQNTVRASWTGKVGKLNDYSSMGDTE